MSPWLLSMHCPCLSWASCVCLCVHVSAHALTLNCTSLPAHDCVQEAPQLHNALVVRRSDVCCMAFLNNRSPRLSRIDACGICADVLRKPSTLPCRHSFCTGCLLMLKQPSVDRLYTIPCPTCRTTFSFDSETDLPLDVAAAVCWDASGLAPTLGSAVHAVSSIGVLKDICVVIGQAMLLRIRLRVVMMQENERVVRSHQSGKEDITTGTFRANRAVG